MLIGVVVLLLILCVLGLPYWPHANGWGYGPSGGFGLVLLVIVLILLFGGGAGFSTHGCNAHW